MYKYFKEWVIANFTVADESLSDDRWKVILDKDQQHTCTDPHVPERGDNYDDDAKHYDDINDDTCNDDDDDLTYTFNY